MTKSGGPNRKDKDLVDAAKAFSKAFGDSVAAQTSPTSFAPGSGISFGASGVIEMTEEVATAQAVFRERAMKLLGPKAGHEKAFDQTLLKQAHANAVAEAPLDDAAAALIDAVFDQGLVAYEYAAPNRLFRFVGGVKEVRIGAVRAMSTVDLQIEREAAYPNGSVVITPGEGFSLSLHGDGPHVITMFGTCWVVQVDAIAENVEEEGKWLIDVAISLLRLSHLGWKGVHPVIGDPEPHPIHQTIAHNEGVKLQGSKMLAGGGKVLAWYEIDPDVISTVSTAEFLAKAAALFSPAKESLAGRVSQGLGWLSRGRQSTDRAERLLYFFTAIEALLSGNDKTAPVVQTIARHAAVLLTNDNAKRAQYAAQLKQLYNLRSALVHNGQRGVNWSAANAAQEFAEGLFYVVLHRAQLTSKHETFSAELAAASYGMPWPPVP